MKKILAKIKAFIRKILGKAAADIIVPIKTALPWDQCTKSSNWWGANAAHRAMNALSPAFTEAKFKEYVKKHNDRGCNCVNLFVCNKADGEGAGYSIYGKAPFSGSIKNDVAKMMIKRMEYCRDEGMGVWVWLMSDDSADWNKKLLSNPAQYAKDLKDGGFLDDSLVSGVVLGLEMEEYCNANQAKNLYNAIKAQWKGKIGTHSVSDKFSFAAYGDIVFLQVNPGTDKKKICNFVNNVAAKTGKKICMFEMERQPDNAKSKYVLENSKAFSVGNW